MASSLIKTVMQKIKFFIYIFLLINISTFAQGGASSCAELEANFEQYQSCATSIPFSNSTGGNNETFNTSCIPTAYVGPTWFFIEIKNPGNVVLQINQSDLNGNGADVDFVLWGPFNNLTNICNQLNQSTESDCSYSAAAVETVSIPNSNTGDLYVLLIDNFAGVSGNISVSQTGGNGTTNCDFLSSVAIKNNNGSEITQFDYCRPNTKNITAFIDISDFTGDLNNLRFNYTWFKDGIQIGNPIIDSNNNTNTLTTTESGVYKVVAFAYDIINNPDQDDPSPNQGEDEVELKFHLTPDVKIDLINYPCLNSSPELTSSIVNASSMQGNIDVLSYQWFLNNTPISGATGTNYIPTEIGDYFVRVSNTPCSTSDSNTISIINNPVVIANPTPLELCNDSGYATFNLKSNETQITNATPYQTVSFKYYTNSNDALANNSNTINNPSNFTNTDAFYQKIYIQVTNVINNITNATCYTVLEQELYVRNYPENNLLNRPYTICIDQQNNITYPVEIKTNLNPNQYSFTWFNNFDAISGNEIMGEVGASFTTVTEGDFSVMVTNISNTALCSSVFNFTTKNSLIPNNISATPDELIGFDIDFNTITAIVTPPSNDYLYSIDGETWQENNIFTNVPAGEYNLIVMNKFGCGQIATRIHVVDFPKFFTPNGDGYNDTWNIKGSAILEAIQIRIFDRYGKFIKQISTDGEGWNGTFNGQLMPAGDYWFQLKYVKNGITSEYKDHFTLKR